MSLVTLIMSHMFDKNMLSFINLSLEINTKVYLPNRLNIL